LSGIKKTRAEGRESRSGIQKTKQQEAATYKETRKGKVEGEKEMKIIVYKGKKH